MPLDLFVKNRNAMLREFGISEGQKSDSEMYYHIGCLINMLAENVMSYVTEQVLFTYTFTLASEVVII